MLSSTSVASVATPVFFRLEETVHEDRQPRSVVRSQTAQRRHPPDSRAATSAPSIAATSGTFKAATKTCCWTAARDWSACASNCRGSPSGRWWPWPVTAISTTSPGTTNSPSAWCIRPRPDILAAPDGENDLSRCLCRRRHVRGAPRLPVVLRRVPGQGRAGHRVLSRKATCWTWATACCKCCTRRGTRRAASACAKPATETLVQRRHHLRRAADRRRRYHSNLDDYARSLQRLQALPIRTVHGGHFGSFSGTHLRSMIDQWQRSHALKPAVLQEQPAGTITTTPWKTCHEEELPCAPLSHRFISRLLEGRDDFDDNASLAQIRIG